MSTESELYSLIFEGLIDDSPAIVQKLKGVFIADLDLSIPEVQRILNTVGSVVCSGNDLDQIKAKSEKLSSVGALVSIVSLDTDETTEHEELESASESDRQEASETDEFVFELDLDENEKPKPKRKVIHKVSEDISLSDTLRELGIAEEPALEIKASGKIELPAENSDFALELNTEPTTIQLQDTEAQSTVDSGNAGSASIASGLFNDLTIKDVDTGLELVEELVQANEIVEEESQPRENAPQVSNVAPDHSDDLDLSLTLDEPPKIVGKIETKEISSPKKESIVQSSEEQGDFGLLLEEPTTEEAVPATGIVKTDEVQVQTLVDLPKVTQSEVVQENIVELTEEVLPAEDEHTPRLADLAANKQVLSESVSQVEQVVTRKAKRFKFIRNNLDSIIAILVGGALLGVANYFYFQEPNQQNSLLQQARVENDIKQLLKADAKKESNKKTVAWKDVKFESILEKETFKLLANFIVLKDGLRVEKLEVTTPKPIALTEEEIIAGMPPHPWLTKITTEPILLELSSDSNFTTEIPIKAFAIINKKNVRYLSKAKLSGSYDNKKQEVLARVEFEYNLTAGSEDVVFIEKASEEQLSFAGKINIKALQNSR